MDTWQIGEAAGEIWRALEGDKEGMTYAKLLERTHLPKNLFHQGVGWLAREGNIRFAGRGNSVRICLN